MVEGGLSLTGAVACRLRASLGREEGPGLGSVSWMWIQPPAVFRALQAASM